MKKFILFFCCFILFNLSCLSVFAIEQATNTTDSEQPTSITEPISEQPTSITEPISEQLTTNTTDSAGSNIRVSVFLISQILFFFVLCFIINN